MSDTQGSKPLTPLPAAMVPARVTIADGDTQYTCSTPDKAVAHEFIAWFLSGVNGTAVVDIRYDQRENLQPPRVTP